MLNTHIDAEHRYGLLRREALEMAAEVSPTGRRFTEIDSEALHAAEAWNLADDRHVDWN